MSKRHQWRSGGSGSAGAGLASLTQLRAGSSDGADDGGGMDIGSEVDYERSVAASDELGAGPEDFDGTGLLLGDNRVPEAEAAIAERESAGDSSNSKLQERTVEAGAAPTFLNQPASSAGQTMPNNEDDPPAQQQEPPPPPAATTSFASSPQSAPQTSPILPPEQLNLLSHCFDASQAVLENCRCHRSCASCGFSQAPTAPHDCLACTLPESPVSTEFPDGSGSCPEPSSQFLASHYFQHSSVSRLVDAGLQPMAARIHGDEKLNIPDPFDVLPWSHGTGLMIITPHKSSFKPKNFSK